MTDWQQRRKELRGHLYSHHGEVSPGQLSPGLSSLEELELFHEELHRENYMAPPHEHKKSGKIKLLYGEEFLNTLAQTIKERLNG